MTRIHALEYAVDFCEELSRCGNDEAVLACDALTDMLTSLIRQKARRKQKEHRPGTRRLIADIRREAAQKKETHDD